MGLSYSRFTLSEYNENHKCRMCPNKLPNFRDEPNNGYCDQCIAKNKFIMIKLPTDLEEKYNKNRRTFHSLYLYIAWLHNMFNAKNTDGTYVVDGPILAELKRTLFGFTELQMHPSETKNENGPNDFVSFTSSNGFKAIIYASGSRKVVNLTTKNYVLTQWNGAETSHKENGEIIVPETLETVSR
jgi:hypothetical protein